jgi:hypothetical protein
MTTEDALLPWNFYLFNFVIEVKIRGVVEIGYRAKCFDLGSRGRRWGTLTMPEPGILKVPWIDDERNGLSSRKLEKPEDALGSEGSIGDLRLRFERILQVSPNQLFVVFALYCPEKDIRTAYGFERRIFRPAAE